MQTLNVLVDGLYFPEGPRWRDGALYFSDFFRHEVLRLDANGDLTQVVEVPQQPSGLGWLPSGELLIVSMKNRQLLRLDQQGELHEHANLSGYAGGDCNDMVVDAKGRAYVGNFGYDPEAGEKPRAADLCLVATDGSAQVVACDMRFPNGSVITADGSTLIVAESAGRRLTAFQINSDGTLSGRRVWADLGEHVPDGISLDAQLGVWVADPHKRCVFRVTEGGEISDLVETAGRAPFACALGGEDGRTLYVCTAHGSGAQARKSRTGCIESMRVKVAHVDLSQA